MKMSETRELYNRRARKRLDRALPDIFPKPVLIHALRQRWMPPMPRLAADAYWRAHAIRADRLARALAAQSGAPAGWTWRVGSDEGLPVTFRQPPAPYREPRFAKGPGFCCVCGQPVYRFGWHRDLWDAGPNRRAAWHTAVWWRGGSGMRRATTTRCCGACRRNAARRPEGGCGRPRRSTTGCRCFVSGASGATRHGPSSCRIGARPIFRSSTAMCTPPNAPMKPRRAAAAGRPQQRKACRLPMLTPPACPAR